MFLTFFRPTHLPYRQISAFPYTHPTHDVSISSNPPTHPPIHVFFVSNLEKNAHNKGMYHIKKFKVFLAWDHFWKSKGSKGLRPPCYLLTSPALPGLSSPHNNFNVPTHGLRTPGEKMVFTARPKIQSQSQIFRYGRSIFCLPQCPNFQISLIYAFIGCP
jgi:hypothetical protein